MKKSRFTETQIVGVLQEHEKGATVADRGRRHGITETTFYRWKKISQPKTTSLQQSQKCSRTRRRISSSPGLQVVMSKAMRFSNMAMRVGNPPIAGWERTSHPLRALFCAVALLGAFAWPITACTTKGEVESSGLATGRFSPPALALGCFQLSPSAMVRSNDSAWISAIDQVEARPEHVANRQMRDRNYRVLVITQRGQGEGAKGYWYADNGSAAINWIIGDIFSAHVLTFVADSGTIPASLGYGTDLAEAAADRGAVSIRRIRCS